MSIDPFSLGPRTPDQNTRSRLKTFYTSNQAYADQQAQHDASYFRKFSDVVVHTIPERAADVLEVGAGSGGALHPLVEQRPEIRIVARDLSLSAMVNVQRRGQDRVVPVLGDALDLPFEGNSFDAIVCFEVIEHLPDVARAVTEILRVLKRPGHLIFGLPNHASLWTPLEDVVLGRKRLAFGVDGQRGALWWWAQNLRLMVKKRLTATDTFLYREPQLDGGTGGDADAVYYSCPLDLLQHLRRSGGGAWLRRRPIAVSAGLGGSCRLSFRDPACWPGLSTDPPNRPDPSVPSLPPGQVRPRSR